MRVAIFGLGPEGEKFLHEKIGEGYRPGDFVCIDPSQEVLESIHTRFPTTVCIQSTENRFGAPPTEASPSDGLLSPLFDVFLVYVATPANTYPDVLHDLSDHRGISVILPRKDELHEGEWALIAQEAELCGIHLYTPA